MCASTPDAAAPAVTPRAVLLPRQNSSAVAGSNYAVYSNTTLYADKAYMQIFRLDALTPDCDGNGGSGSNHLGKSAFLSGIIITVESSEVSTLRWPNYGTAYPINWDDIVVQPWSAWYGQEQCVLGGCATMFAEKFAPVLAVPPEVRALDPAFADCALAFNGFYDPPLALQTAGSLTTPKPNPPDPPSGQPASPGPSPGSPGPAPTPPPPSPVQNSPDPPSGSPGGLGGIIASALGGAGVPAQQQPSPAGQQPPASPVGQSQQPQSGQPGPAPQNNPVVVGYVGSTPILADPSDPGAVQVNGQTIAPGQSIYVGSTPVSVGAGNIVVGTGSSAQSIPIPQPNSIPPGGVVAVVGGQPVVANPVQPGLYIVNGQIVSAGGSPVTVAGTPVAFSAGSLVVGSGNGAQTIAIPTAAAGYPVAVGYVGGQPVISDPTRPGVYTVNGQTFSAGGAAATIGSSTISVGPGGIVVSGPSGVQTIAAGAAGGGVVADPSHPGVYIYNGQTISVGGPAMTVGGSIISAGPGGVVVSGPSGVQTIAAGAVPGAVVADPSHPGVFVYNGQTISVGGPAMTVGGSTISAGPGGVVINDASGTRTIAPGQSGGFVGAMVFTAGGQTYTAAESQGANGQDIVVIGSITLSAGGPAATLPNGQVVSVAPGGGLVVAGQTLSGWQTSSGNVGSYILSGLGLSQKTTTNSATTTTSSGSSSSSSSSSSKSSGSTTTGAPTMAASATTSKKSSAYPKRRSPPVLALVSLVMLVAFWTATAGI
jgi:hypothetical protein